MNKMSYCTVVKIKWWKTHSTGPGSLTRSISGSAPEESHEEGVFINF